MDPSAVKSPGSRSTPPLAHGAGRSDGTIGQIFEIPCRILCDYLPLSRCLAWGGILLLVVCNAIETGNAFDPGPGDQILRR